MKIDRDYAAKLLATPGAVSRGVNLPDPAELPPSLECDEKELQAAVVRIAERRGWLVYHPFDSRKSKAGYPDLTMVRDRLLFAELKTEAGVLSTDQRLWRDAFQRCGAEWYEWRPRDWQTIVEVLK